jgi:hypothetical protein
MTPRLGLLIKVFKDYKSPGIGADQIPAQMTPITFLDAYAY